MPVTRAGVQLQHSAVSLDGWEIRRRDGGREDCAATDAEGRVGREFSAAVWAKHGGHLPCAVRALQRQCVEFREHGGNGRAIKGKDDNTGDGADADHDQAQDTHQAGIFGLGLRLDHVACVKGGLGL